MTKQTARATIGDEQGFVLISTMLVLVLLLTAATAGMIGTMLDLKSTQHYRSGQQAFYAAEAGVIHALSTINSVAVIDFQKEVYDHWETLFGSAARNMVGAPGITYQVSLELDPTDPTNGGSLVAVGRTATGAERRVRARIRRSGIVGAPGALYLAADSIDATFIGNSFSIDGNDHDLYGNTATASEPMPGVAASNEDAVAGISSERSAGQQDNVIGLGYIADPPTASVMTTWGPDATQLDRMIDDILLNASVVEVGAPMLNGNYTFGTVSAPQITHLTADAVKLNGNAVGVGILIVDGSINISGTLDFTGWVLVRGDTIISTRLDGTTTLLGSAMIYGSLWTGSLEIKVGGTAVIDYCSECLELADGAGGSESGNMPSAMSVTSWEEI